MASAGAKRLPVRPSLPERCWRRRRGENDVGDDSVVNSASGISMLRIDALTRAMRQSIKES